MPKTVEKLSAIALPKLKKPGLHSDGNGLYFQITPSGSRSWLFRYMLHNNRRAMGLGAYPTIPLGDARELARNAARQVRKGFDPIDARDKEKAEARATAAKSITFAAAAEAYIKAKKGEWKNEKHQQQWANTLKTYAEPVFKGTPVSEITPELVYKVLHPIWATKTETASRVRMRIENVLDWAKTKHYRTGENPARWKGNLRHQLASPNKVKKVQHHPALPYAQMKPFIKALRAAEGIAAEATQFTILTAARSGEVREATWDEIDFEKAVWTVPAHRMKGGKEHRKPLSKPALAILKNRFKAKNGRYIFPGGKDGKPLSDMALTQVLRRMGRDDITVHGFRSSFQDWRAEETNYTRDEGEMALAHAINDDVEAAYRRGDLFKKRVALMTDWAAWCGF